MSNEHWDLIVVGAGIVGLGHAVAAHRTGLSVLVLDRDDRPVGASVRNFGHGCVTGQTGEAARYADLARPRWLALSREAGFVARECGTTVVARSTEEIDALAELAEQRGPDEVVLLDAQQVLDRVPVAADGLLGGAFLARDIAVDPRHAVPGLADWLAERTGVEVRWATPVGGVGPGVVTTPSGELTAERIVVCVGHDLDRLAPDVAGGAGLVRCVLQMHRMRHAGPRRFSTALLTGTSLLRYSAFAATDGARRLGRRLATERPELGEAGVNHMITQLPDGDLLVGDTHAYARTPDPWSRTDWDELITDETERLLGRRSPIVQRWQGIYASAPGREFLIEDLQERVTVVSVTSGIGMTTGLGIGADVVAGW